MINRCVYNNYRKVCIYVLPLTKSNKNQHVIFHSSTDCPFYKIQTFSTALNTINQCLVTCTYMSQSVEEEAGLELVWVL